MYCSEMQLRYVCILSKYSLFICLFTKGQIQKYIHLVIHYLPHSVPLWLVCSLACTGQRQDTPWTWIPCHGQVCSPSQRTCTIHSHSCLRHFTMSNMKINESTSLERVEVNRFKGPRPGLWGSEQSQNHG